MEQPLAHGYYLTEFWAVARQRGFSGPDLPTLTGGHTRLAGATCHAVNWSTEMVNYAHKKLIEKLTKLNEEPAAPLAFSEWVKAEAHLAFVRENAESDQLVIGAFGDHTFIHSVIVPNDRLSPVDRNDLMACNLNPSKGIAGYVMMGERGDVTIVRGLQETGTKTLEGATQLIFRRRFEGWNTSGRDYYELNQEYAHVAEIHWRREERAYCRYDAHGDLEPIVSISTSEDRTSGIDIVSFKWDTMEEYLAASNASLVRMFDFTLMRKSEFCGWPTELPQDIDESAHFFYHQKIIPGRASYTKGIQIIQTRRSNEAIFTGITNQWFGREDNKYVEFTAYDWRDGKTKQISTDPKATTNYFSAASNSLPFEMSPAFFRPEVLQQYKADRDKYTVGERDVLCRAAWHLRGFDLNEAGQIHAYIRYLRDLPYKEQLHWLAFNEEPRAEISERAIINDFKGEFVLLVGPLQKLLCIVQQWDKKKVPWWKLRHRNLLTRVNTPVAASHSEWAEAFMDLAKLVVEGFERNFIRSKLDAAHVSYTDEGTIALLEKLINRVRSSAEVSKLNGLRTVQRIRSKAKGHAVGSEAEQLAQDAIMAYETYGNHFRHLCIQVADELAVIETLMS